MTKETVLKDCFGFNAFRPLQAEIIDSLLSGKDTLAVLPTGAGKSVCFQVPALMLPGITLVISPLVALMKDQVSALKEKGVPALYLSAGHSENEMAFLFRALQKGTYRLLYIAPERLRSARFQAVVKTLPLSMVVVDEAHCVSQWGHDFRPSYLEIAQFLSGVSPRPVVFACTATATARVRADICESLRLSDHARFVGSFDRKNLFFEVRRTVNKEALLRSYLRSFADRSGIVYCATRKTVDALFLTLAAEGFSVCRYHAGMRTDERRAQQNAFSSDERRVMICTNAFGMGIDKANVAFVIHYQMPADLESYYQEAGRAGRNGARADCVLFYDPRDAMLQRFLIDRSASQMQGNAPENRLQLRQKEERLSSMRRYALSKTCLRAEILRYFGETAPEHCGICGVCCAENRTLLHPEPLPEPQPDPALLKRLTALCRTVAAQNGVPSFAVFTHRTLERMAAIRPLTEQAFGQIKGVTARKKEKYAAVFLKEIHKSQRKS